MITAVLIVKNEEVMLPTCLQSLNGLDILVSDTGSTDNTVEIAKQYGKVLTSYKWKDDFANARNFAKKHAKGEWILSIDADEELLTPVKDLEQAVNQATSDAIQVTMTDGFGTTYQVPRLFRNKKGINWKGAIHETINVLAEPSNITILYRSSPAHDQDPDRSLRILEKEAKNGKPRDLYYLAREYGYKERWDDAMATYMEYLDIATWKPEKADAFLQVARILWAQSYGDKAREYCLNAILLNPNFKEALYFMAEMSWEEQAVTWRKYAEIADNSNVLFVRSSVE